MKEKIYYRSPQSKLPPAARFWPDGVKDRFIERVAIMREGNRIPENEETPVEVYLAAADEAEKDVKLIGETK